MTLDKTILKLLFVSIVTSISFAANAQSLQLKGVLKDTSENANIAGATVRLTIPSNANFSKQVVTGKTGDFQFSNLAAAVYLITISNIGYLTLEQKINLRASNANPIPFLIGKDTKALEGVTITSKAPPVKQKGDTVEFSANQFKVNPDATAEDLIKKLPGITVAKDGSVTSMGEQVRKVTVDGKDFFGDDATAALRNLPAEVIEKIQVFDKLSDQAQLTGFDDGNSAKTVNIVTKNGIKNGQFGRIFAGAGTDSRYAAGGNISFFEGNRRLSLVGNFNNINQQNFSNQDLLGVISSGGNNRGGGGNRGGGADNFLVGQASGINRTKAGGINYSNQYGKNLIVSGSYFYNYGKNTNENITNSQTFFNPKNLFRYQKQNSNAINTNHRLNLRVEYKLDSANSIFIIPNISFQNNNSSSTSSSQYFYATNDSLNTSANTNTSNRNGFNISNTVMFRHAFKKRGRSFSLSLTTAWNKNDGETYSNTDYRFYRIGVTADSSLDRLTNSISDGSTLRANFAYTEPLGKRANLQIDFTKSSQKSNSNQESFKSDGAKYNIFDANLSNLFDNTIQTNNGGINYRFNKNRDEQLSFGLNVQNSILESQRIYPKASSVNQSFFNFLPNANYRIKIGKYSNVRTFYRASTVFPNINQLQDVVNNNNPVRVSSGNPDLKPSYTHFISSRYSFTNTKNSRSFFANLILQTANDNIVNGTFLASKDSIIQQNNKLDSGAIFSKPINLNGYKNLNTFFTFSTPIKLIKSTININTGFNYSKFPGLISNEKIFTNSYAYNLGLVIGSNISEFVDFNVSYSANWSESKTKTSFKSTIAKSLYQSIGTQLNLLSKSGGWFLQNDLSGNINSGLSGGLNSTFWLWNTSTGKKIFKKRTGEIKLTIFDLLKQNQSIGRTVNGNTITDTQTEVLKQFFMLTFTYKLKNFGTPAKQSSSNRDSNRRRGEGNGGQQGGGYVPGF